MRSAPVDLELDHLIVVHAGDREWSMSEKVTAVDARSLLTDPFSIIDQL